MEAGVGDAKDVVRKGTATTTNDLAAAAAAAGTQIGG